MMKWSSSGIAVEVEAPRGDPEVASAREDLPALLQRAGVGLKPTLDIVSDGWKKVVSIHTLYIWNGLELTGVQCCSENLILFIYSFLNFKHCASCFTTN